MSPAGRLMTVGRRLPVMGAATRVPLRWGARQHQVHRRDVAREDGVAVGVRVPAPAGELASAVTRRGRTWWWRQRQQPAGDERAAGDGNDPLYGSMVPLFVLGPRCPSASACQPPALLRACGVGERRRRCRQ